MNKWKLEVICPRGHNKKIVLFYTGHEFMFSCAECEFPFNNAWWEPTDKELKENGVTLS